MIIVPVATPDPAAALSGTAALWAVTVTNGSGTKTVEVQGTQATAWAWVEAAAAHGAFGPGAWAPAAIKVAGSAGPAFEVIA
jgi:hypothetical protein